MKMKLGLVSLLLSGMLIEVAARAADHSTVMPFVADDVVAIAYFDLTAIDTSALPKQLRELAGVPQDLWDGAARGVVKTQQWLDNLVSSGATRIYLLLRTTDLQHAGSSWVLTLTDEADADTVMRLMADPFAGANRPDFFPHDFQIVDGALLAAMDKEQLKRLAIRRVGEPRAEAIAALGEVGNGSAGLVVLGDTDSRRVLREMFPRLPTPFDSIDGPMIADELLWGGVAVDLLPQPKVTIHIETSGPRVAETLQQSAVKGLELATQQLMARMSDAKIQVPPGGVPQILAVFQPKIEGAAVKLTFGPDAEEVARLRGLLTPPLAAASEAAQRKRRINQFKQLALAFLNYESAHRVFVGQANYDQAGQPLLSWRVHLLPYLDQQALYAEFRLDEPWDSPHNRQLIARMPEVFADPNAAVRHAVGAGRTTFVAPVAAETLLPPREALPAGEPLTIRDVKDGVSKTILFVEVIPARAVVWTKPEDWNVNLDNPLQGVKRMDRSGFVTTFADGHVVYISNDIDAQILRAMLTRAGGEPVDE